MRIKREFKNALAPFLVKGHVTEEARHQEEQLHPEGVADLRELCDDRSGRDVHDGPSDEDGHEGHACVKHDAKEQRERSHSIEVVQAITDVWCVHDFGIPG